MVFFRAKKVTFFRAKKVTFFRAKKVGFLGSKRVKKSRNGGSESERSSISSSRSSHTHFYFVKMLHIVSVIITVVTLRCYGTVMFDYYLLVQGCV